MYYYIIYTNYYSLDYSGKERGFADGISDKTMGPRDGWRTKVGLHERSAAHKKALIARSNFKKDQLKSDLNKRRLQFQNSD